MSSENASNPIQAAGGRKLVAVVHVDMVGYSRLIGLDDIGTVERLRTLRRDLIDPAIAEHGGRIVQTGGDSLLVVFDSIDGAVRCALKVQQQVPAHDRDQPPDRSIRFRVGIDIGDAIADGTDLHGDAVNVAARLQAECPPSGVCVTRAVRDHVRGRLDLVFEELGALSLKNIVEPVEAFVIRPRGAIARSVERALVQGTGEALPLPDKPSRYPEYHLTYRWLAAALGQLDRTEEARGALDKAIELAPQSFEFYTSRRPPWHLPANYEHMLDGLRKAGWQG